MTYLTYRCPLYMYVTATLCMWIINNQNMYVNNSSIIFRNVTILHQLNKLEVLLLCVTYQKKNMFTRFFVNSLQRCLNDEHDDDDDADDDDYVYDNDNHDYWMMIATTMMMKVLLLLMIMMTATIALRILVTVIQE